MFSPQRVSRTNHTGITLTAVAWHNAVRVILSVRASKGFQHKGFHVPTTPVLKAGGKPSTRFPPGKLVQHAT